MNDNIIGVCASCGARLDVLQIRAGCPNCRLQRVQQAFAPTRHSAEWWAMRSADNFVWHGPRPPAPKAEGVPEGCKLPPDDQQVYQLKRLFRL